MILLVIAKQEEQVMAKRIKPEDYPDFESYNNAIHKEVMQENCIGVTCIVAISLMSAAMVDMLFQMGWF